MPRATWFCVDVECSGPVPPLYDLLSLGCVRVAEKNGGFELSDPFYVEIKPVSGRFQPGAMAVHGLNLATLTRDGLVIDDALLALSEFVARETLPGTKPVFVGHNAVFDWAFVNYAYAAAGLINPFGYKALDTKALAMGVLGLHWFDTNKEVLAERLTLPDPGQVHRADDDALHQAHILVELLKRGQPCADL